LAIGVILFLFYAFFAGLTIQFYASFVFLFYSLTNSMWISVVMLGAFQTLLLIPFRIVNLLKSANIKEFKQTLEKMEIEKQEEYFLKRKVEKGEKLVLYYMVNFYVQLISYISIGRLFLTDFYNTKLDPWLLYDFVPYPDYPIQDRWFKIPYAWFHNTTDLGSKAALWVWLGLAVIQIIIFVIIYFRRKNRVAALVNKGDESPRAKLIRTMRRFSTGYLVLGLVLSWYLVRNFPIDWRFHIFTGDVSIPNRTLNTVTAIMTFFTLVWVSMPKISKKIELARAAGFDQKVIERTEKELFKQTFLFAILVGLGAFYVTNLIPSAFELSIFTLELIALLSPLTLDRLILRSVGKDEERKGKEADKKSAPVAAT
jgi:hypothetical protein